MVPDYLDSKAIVARPPTALKLNPRNARTHSARQVKQIAKSIKAFGFTNPILVDEHGLVLAGHGRLAAAKQLGLSSVPTLSLDGLSEAQKRAYVLADNRLAEKAGWDRGLLSAELGELAILLPTLDVDWSVDVTGFGTVEIDARGQTDKAKARAEAKAKAPEDVVPVDEGPTVTRSGDLWLLGPHRVLCGEAGSITDMDLVMDGTLADMVFTDLPAKAPSAGQGTCNQSHGAYALAENAMDEVAYADFLRATLNNAERASRPGAIHDVCVDWRHIVRLVDIGQAIYGGLLDLCVWDKGTPEPGSFYRSQHKLVAIFRAGSDASHVDDVTLQQYECERGNVWTYPGVSRSGDARATAAAIRPALKPTALVCDALCDCTAQGDRVLDPFLGQGTTLIAAEKVGRVCHGLEVDPRNVDTLVRRWQTCAMGTAVLAGDGRSFDAIADDRATQA